MYQYQPDHNAVFASAEPTHQWRYDAGGRINGGLAVVGGTLYVESFAPAVTALDRNTGRVLWRTRMPHVVMTTPIVADGLVIVGTGTNHVAVNHSRTLIWGVPGGDEIAALDKDSGRIAWTYRTVGEDMPSPALATVGTRDAVVFANGDSHVRALDLRTGQLLWSSQLLGSSSMASAAVDGGVIYVATSVWAGTNPDHVYAVRASDGHIIWTAPYGNSDGSPVVAQHEVVVEDDLTLPGPPNANAANDVYALDTRSGNLLWGRRSGPGYFTDVATNEGAIAGMIERGVLFQSFPAARRFAAFDLVTGNTIWTVRTVAAVKMSAVAASGRLYFGDTAGILYTVREGDGRVLARRRFAAPFSCSSPVIVGSTLYVADGSTVEALPLK
jgi:outer membrane protein assembly factor BamB